ncbi:hypothetical protein QN391_24200 [Pseudomonas sp. CCI1.2]|uniref:hypothetical protein n=1 Tax=Pseudomonas sp. CCI1.2 TaxID=3048614 RepID=UPI002B22AD34|nr:hypothetical protein [Pseudomonas sp. CCI1.2]MEB0123762.1 hypothetical protein [Pseudomonas sp. CCI1.2]
MADMQASETREALIAILSTAASMGIDIELLCHLSAAQLDSDSMPESQRVFVAGAIYQIGVCMNYVVDAPR